MNILMIVTYFPPDTTMGAVRPFMFAKYLRKAGHQVTVLRSGEILNKADRTYDYDELGIRVFSFMGQNCDAERFMRGESLENKYYGKRKMANLPELIRTPLVWCYRRADFFRKLRNVQRRLEQQKVWIDANRNEKFDVVFATYSCLENVYAGKYAAEVFGCKCILDFRDPIAQKTRDYLWEYPIMKNIQKKVIHFADVCTAVSAGFAEQMAEGTDCEIRTLYNGFDKMVGEAVAAPNDGILRFCYTGILYEKKSEATGLFKALRQLADEGKVDLTKVCFEYAGPHFDLIYAQAKTYGVEKILLDHDFVSRTEAYEIQCRSDIFLVLSWNMDHERGVLPAKIYEGIRAQKPTLSLVTGERPCSELNLLNEKYNYGYCFETCREKEQFVGLRNWVENAYACKRMGKPIPYNPEPGLFTDFHYENLSKKLEKIMVEISVMPIN